MRKFTVCLSPDLLKLHDTENSIIVISDVLRATSSMTAGIGSGIKSIFPVASVEECKALGEKGYVTAGERGGIKIPEFSLGNSPFEFMDESLKGMKRGRRNSADLDAAVAARTPEGKYKEESR